MIDDQGEVIAEYQDRKSIEEEVIKHNKKHFTQACNAKVRRDKMDNRLPKDDVRDKALNGALHPEDCDEKYVHKFLSLLKKGKDSKDQLSFGEMSEI